MSLGSRIVGASVVALLIVALATGIGAAAQTDRQRYEAAIKKAALPFGSFAPPSRKLSKAMCVCNPTDAVGFVEAFDFGNGTVGVTCTVYSFNPDGSLVGGSGCNDWTLITK